MFHYDCSLCLFFLSILKSFRIYILLVERAQPLNPPPHSATHNKEALWTWACPPCGIKHHYTNTSARSQQTAHQHFDPSWCFQLFLSPNKSSSWNISQLKKSTSTWTHKKKMIYHYADWQLQENLNKKVHLADACKKFNTHIQNLQKIMTRKWQRMQKIATFHNNHATISQINTSLLKEDELKRFLHLCLITLIYHLKL